MEPKDVVDIIVEWLKEKSKEAGTKGFVVGVSGGIDSAVTSTLCAMTGETVGVASMPVINESDLSKRHILWLKEKFRSVHWTHVDLTETFRALKRSMIWIKDDLAWANAKARLRMTALYAYANNYNMLVAGTGNRVEDLGLGFFTKYGDGGVDISPIGDLLKSEVYKLAKHLGIIEEILSAKPTDGLWEDGRTDEDQIGATYEEIEWAMSFELRIGDVSKLDGREKEVWDLYRERHNKNAHKMMPIPICYVGKRKE